MQANKAIYVFPIKQSEMVDTYVGLGDSQGKPSCESGLAAASTRPGATTRDVGTEGLLRLGLLRPVVYLIGLRKL